MPGKEHMKGVSPKRNRQYEHIKDSLEDSGKSEERSKEEAARTVNKQRREKGETKDSKVSSVELIPGPFTSEMTRQAAERGLQQHPSIREGANYALEQMDGRWVAAIIHEAAPPPFGGGGPADADEEAPSPKSEGPDDAEPSEGGESDSDSGSDSESGGESGPPSKSKGGEKGELHQVMQMLQQIGEALGIPLDLGASPVPGQDEMGGAGPTGPPPPGPGPGGPPGAGGPPGGEPQRVIHQRTMKPGEVPPGGTPVGAPAFGSVRANHPWARVAGQVASFEVVEKIGDTPLHHIAQEVDSLSREIGYRYKLREARDKSGNRIAVALITKH